jgi:hypothetical protein
MGADIGPPVLGYYISYQYKPKNSTRPLDASLREVIIVGAEFAVLPNVGDYVALDERSANDAGN